MKKQLLDFLIKENQRINDNYSLLKLSPADGSRIIDTVAGQFVQVEVPDSKATFLRRPISINYVDRADNTLWLLIRKAGLGTEALLGARRDVDLLELDLFNQVGIVYCSTEDGSTGEKGLITHNTALNQQWDYIYCCGPMPMMKAIARYAVKNNIECEVSLENRMACGVGACLCCVEDTADSGNVCVCTDGPVFNIKRLKWEI